MKHRRSDVRFVNQVASFLEDVIQELSLRSVDVAVYHSSLRAAVIPFDLCVDTSLAKGDFTT